MHARDFEERSGFTYTVLDPDDGDVIGCVYIYPLRPADGDDAAAPSAGTASVRSWVRADRAELDEPLWQRGQRLARGGLAVRARRLRAPAAERSSARAAHRLVARRRAPVRSVDHGTALLPQARDPAAGGRRARRDRPARRVEIARRAGGHGRVVVDGAQRARRARGARPAHASAHVRGARPDRARLPRLRGAARRRDRRAAGADRARRRHRPERARGAPCARRPRRSPRRRACSPSSPHRRSGPPRCATSTSCSCSRAP